MLPDWRDRGYITILRRNWHLLPYEQILILLDRTAEDLAVSLREDDFLFIKLGSLKPKCAPVRWENPSASAKQRAAEIKQVVAEHFGPSLNQPHEPAFQFIADIKEFTLPRPYRCGDHCRSEYSNHQWGASVKPIGQSDGLGLGMARAWRWNGNHSAVAQRGLVHCPTYPLLKPFRRIRNRM
ncbi:hypothetical protein [Novipirellula artificiosorum]|uniref:Uncharacterized protein n=1 Tax=Novipirellula artificiosorum TaxID=2528016 RepID=A0A5C6DH71_9BACT|nr:hypothetical protein [Novipirellula artificiosorum]TWU34299.1 hypothetical protein Poly41_44460 [Novipirellula artificiosorum]